MTSVEFATAMVERLQTLLLANPAAQSVSIDGQSVTYLDAQKRLAYYEAIVARATGTSPRVATIKVADC